MVFETNNVFLNSNFVHLVLLKHNAFYRGLSAALQRDFRLRVNYFIQQKEFKGGYDTQLTSEQVVAVSGAAIQVTFGLKNYLLETFDTIIIYPEMYKSLITGQYHKGEVNPQQGVIVISWKDFVFGNQEGHDKLNVGLHEMGHAFYFYTHILRDDIITTYDFLSKFLFMSEAEIVRIRQNHSSLFRKYAGENAAEFFAIAVEYFFEACDEFYEKMPELYRYLCLVLRVDPRRKIYRNLDFTEYFSQQNFDDYNVKKETIILNADKSNFRIEYIFATQILLLQSVLTLIGVVLFSVLYAYYSVIILVLSGFLFHHFIKLFYSQRIEASTNYLIVHRYGFRGKRIQGIHFDNVLSVDLGTDRNTLFIRYFDNHRLHGLYIGKRFFTDGNEFLFYLAKRNLMLKNNGQRITRIKAKRFWR